MSVAEGEDGREHGNYGVWLPPSKKPQEGGINGWWTVMLNELCMSLFSLPSKWLQLAKNREIEVYDGAWLQERRFVS